MANLSDYRKAIEACRKTAHACRKYPIEGVPVEMALLVKTTATTCETNVEILERGSRRFILAAIEACESCASACWKLATAEHSLAAALCEKCAGACRIVDSMRL